MRTSIREQFHNNFKFVKPLYRKTKYHSKCDKGIVPISFDRTVKLGGDDFDVNTVITKFANIKREINNEYKVVLPGACDSDNILDNESKLNKLYIKILNEKCTARTPYNNFTKMIEQSKTNIDNVIVNKTLRTSSSYPIIIHKVPDTWLRIYPALKLPGETVCSILIRCILCQLGLVTFLILWTIIAVFVIESFEGPHELRVSLEFEKDQNQLVIDLATELRQITPVSPKWRNAIEKRIEDERQLTMIAVGQGAKLKYGCFWNLSGTFLFTIYVMTALGFGAPVPHTLWGRTMGLVYALFAVPTHIYLMMNVSTLVAVKVEYCTKYLKNNCGRRSEETSEQDNAIKPLKSTEKSTCRQCFVSCISVFLVGRCVPFALFSYYTLGLISFGILRNKTSLEAIVFPLEFTTTGGLEHVASHVRILYGLYIEGVMCLFAYTATSIKRSTNATLETWGTHYRIFEKDMCKDCDIDNDIIQK